MKKHLHLFFSTITLILLILPSVQAQTYDANLDSVYRVDGQ